jgi:hypothetical protein
MRPDAGRALRTAVVAACRAIAGPVLPLPQAAGLRNCPECERDRIAVVEQSLHGHGPGLLRLRCGDCGRSWERVATAAEARGLLAFHATQRRAMRDALAIADPDGVTRDLDALLRRYSRVPRKEEPR